MSGKKSESDQAEEFRRVARELGCDEDEERFNERLKRIARKGKKPKDDEASND